MPLPVAARLVDFGPLRRQGAIDADLSPSARAAAHEAVDAAAARVACAREEGIAIGKADMEHALAAQQAVFEGRLAEARAQWTEQEGDEIARRFEAAFARLRGDVRDSVASILAPFLEEAVRDRVVGDLTRVLDGLLAGEQGVVLQISGPEDLLNRLRHRMGKPGEALRFESTDAVEIKVVADKTVIETQIGAWLRQIGIRGK